MYLATKIRFLRLPVFARPGVLLIVLLAATAAGAIPLSDYNKNLKAAYVLAGQLAVYDETVFSEADRNQDYENEMLDKIRRVLPASQKIEYEGLEIEADNRWIELTAAAYRSEEEDFELRRQYTMGMEERIGAISAKVEELLGPKTAGRSKDEEKTKLAEILSRPDFQKPEEKSESFFGRIAREIEEWFNRKFPNPKVPKGAKESAQALSTGLQIVLYVLLALFIGFLIWKFGPYLLDRVKKRNKNKTGDRVILGEQLSADQDSNSLFDEAEALARSGNLRAAIRKGYIAFLCELSDRRVIGLAQHKTNRDYLRDVRKKGELHRNMNGLTNRFERHWYGLDNASEQDWNDFKETYRQTLKGEF